MRKLVAKSLKEIGFTNIVEASDGVKAWETISSSSSPVHIIISDWNMPNATGLDLLKRVRSDGRYKGVPFLLLTAESDQAQVKEAIVAGVDSYIVKPFTKDQIEAKLKEVFERKKSAA
jgi:two-component system chemotaxis response regulator CheY